jgi:hypothetical protein
MAYTFNTENNRSDWEFEHLGSELLEGAKKKEEFRRARLGWWKDQKDKVMQTIKESGLEVQESLALQYSSASNNINALRGGHSGAQIVVRNDLQDKLNECHSKIREHEAASIEYNAWVQVFSRNQTKTFKLKQGDWLFFFGE